MTQGPSVSDSVPERAVASDTTETRTKRVARIALVVATCAIAVAYGSAFLPGGAPPWGPWLLALGIPAALGGIMLLGASRGRGGVGRLAWPFAFVILTLAVGFSIALALPANESASSNLWLGLPLRAAVVLYGVGLLPIIVLPVAYALTFDTQTLTAADVERVRQLGNARTEPPR
ncbi:MAG: hypothetical protein ACR2M1_00595 [Gemmatimonadaceae bacterium]